MDEIVGIHSPVRLIAMPNRRKGKDYAKYAAVALEVNAWAFDDKQDKAMFKLMELVDMKIEGCLSLKMPEAIESPAKKEWFDLWDELQEASKPGAKKQGRPRKLVKDSIWMELRRSVTPSNEWKEYEIPVTLKGKPPVDPKGKVSVTSKELSVA